MAQVLVEVMTALGFDHSGLAGHDRGGRMAYRLALDHPTRVRRLAVCDMVPTLDEAEHTDWRLAWSTYHWFFLVQPVPLPETLIGQVPDFYVHHTLYSWVGKPEAIAPEAMAEYVRCFRRPTVMRHGRSPRGSGTGTGAVFPGGLMPSESFRWGHVLETGRLHAPPASRML